MNPSQGSGPQERPLPFSTCTTQELWTDPHRSARMLRFHLDGAGALASGTTRTVEATVDWIVETFRPGPGNTVLDLGCGPGLYTHRLARTGAAVTGIDFSGRSLTHARGQAEGEGLTIRYVRGNYLDGLPEGRYDIVMMIMRDFCVLSSSGRRRLLTVVRDRLRPGGVVLLDVDSLVAFAEFREGTRSAAFPQGGFWSPRPYEEFHTLLRYDVEQVSLDRTTVVEAEREFVHDEWTQYYSPGSLSEEVDPMGLRIEGVFGDLTGAAYDPLDAQFAVSLRHVVHRFR